jgi:hypothetical protein
MLFATSLQSRGNLLLDRTGLTSKYPAPFPYQKSKDSGIYIHGMTHSREIRFKMVLFRQDDCKVIAVE